MTRPSPTYLDYAASTPLDGRVLEAMMPFLTEEYGNASSNTHVQGDAARAAVDKATNQVAQVIGAAASEIIFTSGATESINLCIKGLYDKNKENKNHIITVSTEHKAVLDTCEYLEEKGADIDYLNVGSNGIIDLRELEGKLSKKTLLVCVMIANNETGVIQDVQKIAQLAHDSGAYFFTDASQAFGKISIDVVDMGIDILSISGHKIYGPKGVGALYVKSGIKITEQIQGGGHQRGMRSGTLNVPAIVGLGEAGRLALESLNEESSRLSTLRDDFERALFDQKKIKVNGFVSNRLPNVSNIQLLEYNDADEFILMNRCKVSVSTGSACNSEVIEPSHVLKNMGLTDASANRSIRVSIGRMTNSLDLITSLIAKK